MEDHAGAPAVLAAVDPAVALDGCVKIAAKIGQGPALLEGLDQ